MNSSIFRAIGNRVNLQAIKQFWSLSKKYWLGPEKWQALGLLLLLLAMLVTYTWLSVRLNRLSGEIFSSLTAADRPRFTQTIVQILIVIGIYIPLFSGFSYLQHRLGLYWRRWMTSNYLDRYFRDRAYYNLGNISSADGNGDLLDNPDERISEGIKNFTQSSLFFLLVFLNSTFQAIAFSFVLWDISQHLVYSLFVYIVLGTLVALFFFGRILVRINYKQLQKEADFRFGLVRMRENAEAIAFYRGESQEQRQLGDRFGEVFRNFNLLILWRELGLGMYKNAYEFIPDILPALVVAPAIFAGDLEVGKLREAQGAFFRIFLALNLIVERFELLTQFAAGIERLYTLNDYLDARETVPQNGRGAASDKRPLGMPKIDFVESNRLAIERLTLQTPNYQRVLIRDLSVEVAPERGLLIKGASGCGKSSLMRAIAGLWDSGTGKILRPHRQEILFLPQRPYMILGDLRDQLIYPSTETDLDDRDLQRILEQVNLPNLRDRFGGWDAQEHWSEVLSLGEQQRVAFARLLANRPRYAILDEATSALDEENEERLYQHLQASQTTYISVGHRSSLDAYHQQILYLYEGDRWELH